MKAPTAIAPTTRLAEPRVRKFVDGPLLERFGGTATVERFYICEPHTRNVCSISSGEGEEWIEGMWGLSISTKNRMTLIDLVHLTDISQLISVEDIAIEPCKDGVWYDLFLAARVMHD